MAQVWSKSSKRESSPKVILFFKLHLLVPDVLPCFFIILEQLWIAQCNHFIFFWYRAPCYLGPINYSKMGDPFYATTFHQMSSAMMSHWNVGLVLQVIDVDETQWHNMALWLELATFIVVETWCTNHSLHLFLKYYWRGWWMLCVIGVWFVVGLH